MSGNDHRQGLYNQSLEKTERFRRKSFAGWENSLKNEFEKNFLKGVKK